MPVKEGKINVIGASLREDEISVADYFLLESFVGQHSIRNGETRSPYIRHIVWQ